MFGTECPVVESPSVLPLIDFSSFTCQMGLPKSSLILISNRKIRYQWKTMHGLEHEGEEIISVKGQTGNILGSVVCIFSVVQLNTRKIDTDNV